MRWFVLRDSKLMYYDNDSEEKLKGTIDIRAAKYDFFLKTHLIHYLDRFSQTCVPFGVSQGDCG